MTYDTDKEQRDWKGHCSAEVEEAIKEIDRIYCAGSGRDWGLMRDIAAMVVSVRAATSDPCQHCHGLGKALPSSDAATAGSGPHNIFEDEDHQRGCQGRTYACTCGYDDRVIARGAELERQLSASSPSPHLLAVLRRARSYIDNHGAFIAESEMLRQIDHQLSLYVVEKT